MDIVKSVMHGRRDDPEPPWKDADWMGSRDARAIRILSEFIAPQNILIDRGIKDTVVFFGSARTDLEDEDSKAAIELAKRLSTWATTSAENGGGARAD